MDSTTAIGYTCSKYHYHTSHDSVSVVRTTFKVYLCKKNCCVYIQCKGDIVVADIKTAQMTI